MALAAFALMLNVDTGTAQGCCNPCYLTAQMLGRSGPAPAVPVVTVSWLQRTQQCCCGSLPSPLTGHEVLDSLRNLVVFQLCLNGKLSVSLLRRHKASGPGECRFGGDARFGEGTLCWRQSSHQIPSVCVQAYKCL